MRMSKLVGRTIKETPRDSELPSHKFMLRGGFMRQYSAGIYGILPIGMRCISKIEKVNPAIFYKKNDKKDNLKKDKI